MTLRSGFMILSIDDACASDIRAAYLARKYDAEAVFYWPIEWHSLAYSKGYAPLDFDVALMISHQHEIGAHTITHRHLTDLAVPDAMYEIEMSKYMLENIFNVEVTKFCPPRGYTNDELTRFTLRHYQSQRLTRGEGLVHIHPNSGANNNRPWRECIDENTTELWGHSWEIDKFDLWDELEEVLRENAPT